MEEQLRRPLTLRLRQWHWITIDATTAVLCAVFVFTATHWYRSTYHIPSWGGVALIVLVTAPLALRRLWPMSVFAIVQIAGTAGAWLWVVTEPLVWLCVALALYMVGLRVPGRRSAAALGFAIVAACADAASYLMITGRYGFILNAATLGNAAQLGIGGIVVACGAWATGAGLRQQRAYHTRLREQAAHRAVADERLRIARELHDVVSHSMSVIAVEAGIAHYVADSQPSQARRALADIASTSQGALRELRHLLGVLRADTDHGTATLAPAPGLTDLDQLITDADRAGVHVELRIAGVVRPLPPGIDLSVYRIIQEALTNVIKHAAPAHATVTVDYRPLEIVIEITDDGPGQNATRVPGHGLIGMRERAGLYGGTVRAEPLPGHGFRVRASIPTMDGTA